MAVRHHALETCIEWSFRLLRADVKPFFCRLCLLRGEWTLEMAEILTQDSHALDKLQQLRETSFLSAREDSDPAGTIWYFRILESLREFGMERLSPEEIDMWQACLAHALIELPHPNPLSGIDAENLRVLVQWCRTSAAEASLELKLLNALRYLWLSRGGWIEGRYWLQDALRRHAGEETRAYRAAWNMLGSLHWLLRETAEAKRCFNEALAVSEQAGDDALAARALNNLAMTATQEGDLALACALGEQSLRFAQRLEDERLVAALLNNVGSAYLSLGQYETARSYLEQSLHKNREQGVPGMVAMSLVNLGEIAHHLGDRATARLRYEEGLEMLRAVEDQVNVVETLLSLAQVLEEQGEGAQARLLREESAALRLRMEGK